MHTHIDAIGQKILTHFCGCDSFSAEISKLWERCPNKYLWESLESNHVMYINKDHAIKQIERAASFILLPEPLPALYLGAEPAHMIVRLGDIVESKPGGCCNFKHFFADIEPLYVVNKDFNWMIVLTTENTPDGSQLCVLVPSRNMPFDPL